MAGGEEVAQALWYVGPGRAEIRPWRRLAMFLPADALTGFRMNECAIDRAVANTWVSSLIGIALILNGERKPPVPDLPTLKPRMQAVEVVMGIA